VKLREEFEVSQGVAEVWEFLDRPEAVAGCVPGVEQLNVLSRDDIDVRLSQSVGPMSATFAASVHITGREPERQIAFTAVGKSVRGAVGNVRAEVVVALRPGATGTVVSVEGDVALAGALGSVGQKVVSKQAGKVTAQFARNLEAALRGDTPTSADESDGGQASPRQGVLTAVGGPNSAGVIPGQGLWIKVLVALSAAQLVVATLQLLRLVRGAR
jgi:uncharacterized protein